MKHRSEPTKELSWKPVRRGNIYCSSACGASCKLADYNRCVRQAKALAKRMGPGWKTSVDENMHWYYSVYKGESSSHARGFFEITPPQLKGGEYTAWVQSSPQFVESHVDPNTALRMAVKQFDAYLTHINKQRRALGNLML